MPSTQECYNNKTNIKRFKVIYLFWYITVMVNSILYLHRDLIQFSLSLIEQEDINKFQETYNLTGTVSKTKNCLCVKIERRDDVLKGKPQSHGDIRR
jgi:hypothetical protein